MKLSKGKAGIGLTIIAGGGLILTVVLAAKKAPEAQKLKEAALEEKRKTTGDPNAKLTWVESLKAQAGCYAPVIASAAFTMGSMIGSQILPQSALNDITKLHNTYKDMVAKVESKEAAEKIEEMAEVRIQEEKKEKSKSAKEKEDDKVCRWAFKFGDRVIEFTASLLEVLESEYEVNRYFIVCGGEVTLNKFLEFFNCDPIEGGDDVGWQEYLGEIFYGYSWIDFKHRPGEHNGRKVTFIDLPFDAHALTEEGVNDDISKYIGLCTPVAFIDKDDKKKEEPIQAEGGKVE